MIPSSQSGSFLFALPNHIHDVTSRRSFTAGLVLVAVGAVCVLNATVATAVGAVKHYSIGQYFNVHWIACLYILAGIALVLTQTQRLNYFLFMGVTLSTIALCLSLGTIVASIVNLAAVHRYKQAANARQAAAATAAGDPPTVLVSRYEFHSTRQTTALASDSISLMCAIVAMCACAYALHEVRHRTTRYFANVGGRSFRLVITGVVILVVSGGKLVMYSLEMAWLQHHFKHYYFINYTMEEPTWLIVSAVTGILVIQEGLRGSRILLQTSLALALLTYYPNVAFLWIDYRWLTQVSTQPAQAHLARLLNGNLVLSVISIFGSVVASALLALRLARHKVQLFEITLTADHSVRKVLGWLPVMLGLSGVFFLLSDILNGHYGTFFRIFYPTEQKLPFILIPTAAISAFILQDTTLRYLVIPMAFALLYQTIQSTFFHISAYIYLAQNDYFGHQFCELFYNMHRQDCDYRVEVEGAVIHFFEALMAVLVLFVSAVGAVVLGRIMGIHALANPGKPATPSPTDTTLSKSRGFHQAVVLLLGVALLVLALVAFPLSVHFSNAPYNQSSGDHPIFTLHKTINIACFLATYLLLAIAQLAWAKTLAKYPLRAICLILLHCVRIMDILMLMDYRNISNNFTVHNLVILLSELVCLPISFTTIVECGFILDIATKALPLFDFTDTGETDSGYHESPSPLYNTTSHSDSLNTLKVSQRSDSEFGQPNIYSDNEPIRNGNSGKPVNRHATEEPIKSFTAVSTGANGPISNGHSPQLAAELHTIGDTEDHYVQLSDLAMIITDTDDN